MSDALKIIKFSSPAWGKFGYDSLGIIGQTPNNQGVWGNYKFEINNDCAECDYWVIYESTPQVEKVKVPKGNVIFVTSEEVEQRGYSSNYLKQFDKIISSRDDLQGKHVIKDHYINAWFVRKTYDQLLALHPEKSKWLSVIASDLTVLPGHKKRFAFVNKLIGHFKDKIDVYGRGFNPLDDKWDGLAPYRFSLAIENARIEDYFTEKITDCYLAESCPIYMGCPNIEDYFDAQSMLSLDIDNFKKSIQTIESTLENEAYEPRVSAVKSAKLKVLNELQFFPYISRILTKNLDQLNNGMAENAVIYPKSYIDSTIQLKDSLYQTKNAFTHYLQTRFSNK